MVAFVFGALLPVGSFSGDAGRLLTTFLGFVTASILPTISLIVGGMVVGGRSVKHLEDLGKELADTVEALFGLFGLAALAVVILMTLAIPMPFSDYVPDLLRSVPARVGQGMVGFVGVLAIVRSGTIPGAIARSLRLRTSIAVDDAKKRTVENADGAIAKTRAAFATKDGFGKTTNLADLKKPNSDAD